MTLASQPNLYKHEATFGKYRIYAPVNLTEYHTSRYVQMQHQLIYANAGGTKETIQAIAQEIIKRCNDGKSKTVISDISVLANDLLYRTKYPVDEHAAIRLGAVLSFVEWEDTTPDTLITTTHSEDPNKYDAFYTGIKEQLAMNDPEAYSFFLTWGIVNVPTYKEHFDTSIDTDYFRLRREALRSLTPQSVE